MIKTEEFIQNRWLHYDIVSNKKPRQDLDQFRVCFFVRYPDFPEPIPKRRRQADPSNVLPRGSLNRIHRRKKPEIRVDVDRFERERIGECPFIKILVQDLNDSGFGHIQFFKH